MTERFSKIKAKIAKADEGYENSPEAARKASDALNLENRQNAQKQYDPIVKEVVGELLTASRLGMEFSSGAGLLHWDWELVFRQGKGGMISKRLLIELVTGNDGKPSMFSCRRDDRDTHIDKTKTCGLSIDELAACLEELYLI